MVATKAGLYFFDASALPVKCHTDEDEWVGIAGVMDHAQNSILAYISVTWPNSQ